MFLPVASLTANPLRRAVLPAAGLGTRLRPLTRAFPKELLPVGRKPVLAHIATELLGAGITHALFVVSERKPQIRGFFGDVYEDDVTGGALHCTYAVQEEQRGLGDALLCAADWTAGEPFVVAFGDCMIDAPDSAAPLRRLLAAHQSKASDATVLTEQVALEQVSRYGVLAPAEAQPDLPTEPFALMDIVEKPAPHEAPSRNVVAKAGACGRCRCAPASFAATSAVSKPFTRPSSARRSAILSSGRRRGAWPGRFWKRIPRADRADSAFYGSKKV